MLRLIDPKCQLPEIEAEVLKFWQEKDVFKTSLEKSKDCARFTFVDGPPFATGSPHYGHLLAGTLKDVIGRFKTMQGYYVERRAGFDCIAEGTLINLMDGTSIPIEKFNQYDCEVQTYNVNKKGFGFEQKSNFINKGKRECIELTFLDETKLRCTPDHEIYTTNGWVKAKDIREDMQIVSTYINPPLIDFYQDYKWNLDTDTTKLNCNDIYEKKRSAAYVRLLGFMLADGCIFNNTSKDTLVSYNYLGHELDAQMFVNDIELVTGLKPKYRFARDVYAIDLPVKLVRSFASLEGIVIGKRTTQGNIIPEFIKKYDTPKFLKQEFLAGLFGGDGHTTGLKTYKNGNNTFSYCKFSQSKNIHLLEELKETIHDVIKLLNDIGINNVKTFTEHETTASKKKENYDDKSMEYVLYIQKKSMIEFANKVGFRYCISKIIRLGITTSYLLYEKTVKTRENKCKEWLEETNTRELIKKKYAMTREEDVFPYYLTKVTSIKNIGELNVYDLTIDNTHNFVANGIVVHNCHGLPIELKIEQDLGIRSKEEILKYGIENYNQRCREIVLSCVEEWENVLNKMGRWVSFEDKYTTMDKDFMESVWWSFSRLYEMGLVYQSYKIMHYSIGCATPISNFEASQNYKTIAERFVHVTFPLTTGSFAGSSLLVWTTTPWTLPSNMAICVNENFKYDLVQNKKTNVKYIVAEKLTNTVMIGEYEIVNKITGKELIGAQYQQIFNVGPNEHYYKIVADNYVKDDSGTGIVHLAAAHGEDDFRVCLREGIIDKYGKNVLCTINDNGVYTMGELKGISIREATTPILKLLKEKQRFYKVEQKEHAVAICPRTDIPLIYKAVTAWFINVEKIKEKLVQYNKEVKWVPEHVGSKRFANWLENARDWAVSRDRFWGCPIPIWECEETGERICIGSIEQLERLSGVTGITDLHCDTIDKISLTINGKHYKRVNGLMDCWFESGSVPFAMHRYPFTEESEKIVENNMVDFISEGIDQCRGWFYTLLVLSTALFDRPAYKNVIVNGIILAEDGEKMSKRKKNYPDPLIMINKYGADALRLYFLSSPVCQGEDLKFSEKGLFEVAKKMLLCLNTYRFFLQYHTKFITLGHTFDPKVVSTNVLDRWILNHCDLFYAKIYSKLNNYDLYHITAEFKKFLDLLSTGYIKLRRDHLKGKHDVAEWNAALATLYTVLYKLTLIMAPMTPFLTEMMYSQLYKLQPTTEDENESVHYCILSAPKGSTASTVDVDNLLHVIDLIRLVRSNNDIAVRKPLKSIIVCASSAFLDSIRPLLKYVEIECHVLSITFADINTYLELKLTPNLREVGQTFKGNATKVKQYLLTLSQAEMESFVTVGMLETPYGLINRTHVTVNYDVKATDNMKYKCLDNVLVLADTSEDEETRNIYLAREVVKAVQFTRKASNVNSWDKINVYYNVENTTLMEVINKMRDYICELIGTPLLELEGELENVVIERSELPIGNNYKMKVVITR